MVKSAVKAMDMTEEILAIEGVDLDGFVVTGASKRGWTTWLTGAVDSRVKAIAPIVINVLNMQEHLEHHRKVYGYWSPAIYDYAQERVFDRLISSGELEVSAGARTLLEYVDPYEYSQRGRYPMPKFMLNATGDEFFVPDTAEFYYHDLEGEAHMSYVPNVGHGMGGIDGGVVDPDPNNPVRMLLAWYMAVTQTNCCPPVTPLSQMAPALRLSGESALNTYMWRQLQLVRDFRNRTLVRHGSPALRVCQAVKRAYTTPAMPEPNQGNYTAYYVQLVYANRREHCRKSSPPYPIWYFFRCACQLLDYPNLRLKANVETSDAVSFMSPKCPLLFVYGTPRKYGLLCGQLWRLNKHIRARLSPLLAQTGGTISQLRMAGT